MLVDATALVGTPCGRPAARGGRVVAVHILIPPDPLAVRSALGGVLHGLDFLGLSADARGTLELVLAEAMNNVVEHAHGGRDEGLVELRVSHDAARGASVIVCELIDDGEPMPEGALAPPSAPAVDTGVEALPEGGFGWLVIRQLARGIDYARRDGRNRLRFEIDLAEGACKG
jgi:serine/threonine-protein kinase RsbW